MTKITNYLIGSDVEYFIRNKVTNEIISAEGLIKGTKKDPHRFLKSNPYFSTSLDNILAEGNIPPTNEKMQWIHNMAVLRGFIDTTLPPTLCTVAAPAFRIRETWLNTKQAMVFGCEPANIVWERSQTFLPDQSTNLRTAGLHVHVSWDNYDLTVFTDLVKLLDLYLSVPAVLIEPENERRQQYGKAGEFRIGRQYIGVEYRCLSSYFADTDERLGWVFDNTVAAIHAVNQDMTVDDETGQLIQEAVNQANKDIALELVKQFSIPVLYEE